MLGVKEAAIFVCSTLCLAGRNLPQRPDSGDQAQGTQYYHVPGESDPRSSSEVNLDSLTIKEFAYRLDKIVFCEASDLPLMLQRFVLEERARLLRICALHSKDTLLLEVMKAKDAQLFLLSESMVSDIIDDVRVLVQLSGLLQSIDRIPKSQELADKTKKLRGILEIAKDEWERIDYTAPPPRELIQPIQTLATQVRVEYCLRVIGDELRCILDLEGDLRTKSDFREPLLQTKQLMQKVVGLRVKVSEVPGEPKDIEVWRASLNEEIRLAADETLKIFEMIKVSPGDTLRSLATDK